MRLFLNSFKYAFCGFWHCISKERNFRFDIAVIIQILIFKQFYEFDTTQNILLYITIAIVLSAEAFNTSIETVIDLVSPKYSKLAKIAKDTAAGAVLITAITSIVIAFYLFWDIDIFKKIYYYFTDNIVYALGLLLLLIISYCFVFIMFSDNKKRK